jgi:hypothetical protein
VTTRVNLLIDGLSTDLAALPALFNQVLMYGTKLQQSKSVCRQISIQHQSWTGPSLIHLISDGGFPSFVLSPLAYSHQGRRQFVDRQ